MKISEVFIYPLKSAGGISVMSTALDAMGLQYDRRWMLVDETGKFISQRTVPGMALLETALQDGQLVISLPSESRYVVPVFDVSMSRLDVNVWDDVVSAIHLDKRCDKFLSDFLGIDCRLVLIPDDAMRQCDLEYADEGDRTGFADGFPILLISEASLTYINEHLISNHSKPVTMRNFRPNIVVKDCEAFDEDQWQRFQIGDVSFRGVKLCSRCVLTTVNPDKGERREDAEPLKTLLTYRKQGNSVLFGQNVVHTLSSDGVNQIAVGDQVVIDKKGDVPI